MHLILPKELKEPSLLNLSPNRQVVQFFLQSGQQVSARFHSRVGVVLPRDCTLNHPKGQATFPATLVQREDGDGEVMQTE